MVAAIFFYNFAHQFILMAITITPQPSYDDRTEGEHFNGKMWTPRTIHGVCGDYENELVEGKAITKTHLSRLNRPLV